MLKYLYILTISLMLITQKSDGQDTSKVSQLSFFEKGNINGYVFYQFGRVLDFSKDHAGNLDLSKPEYKYRNALGLNLGIHLFEYVFFRSTYYLEMNRKINAPWLVTDFTYSLERTRWDYGSFSYGYSNYQINKYQDIKKNFWSNFLRGSFYFRYFNQLPPTLFKKLGFKNPFKFNYFITAYYAIQYLDGANEVRGNLTHGKPVFSINGRYIFFENFYLEGSANYYPVSSQKVISDADFTYGFGYNKYSRFTVGITYGNYTINRFPWNEKKVKGHGFLDGNFILLFNYKW